MIGGVAAWLVMDEAGGEFRATKDLDIVLIIEALDAAFVNQFWHFIRDGGYRVRQRSGDRPILYRFQNPAKEAYPAQIELFSRKPEGLGHEEGETLTPIPSGEAVSSLSAILLDDAYYAFLLEARQVGSDITHIGASCLIPFKAKAWLDLSRRKDAGEQVDSRNIRKHRNDVLQLSSLLSEEPIPLPEVLQQDMAVFLERIGKEQVRLKDLGLSGELETYVERLKAIFGVTTRTATQP